MKVKYKVKVRAVLCTRCGHTFNSQAERPVCSECRSPVVVDYRPKQEPTHSVTDAQIQTLNNKIVKVVSSVNDFFDEYDKHVQINLDHVKQTDLHRDESQAFEKQVRSALARIKKTFDEANIKMV